MYDVLCEGLCCCDMIFSEMERLPVLGQESYCRDFGLCPGGVSNTAVALSRLNTKTLFATFVGDDFIGEMVYSLLSDTGLDMSAVTKQKDARTAVSASISLKRDRAFATFLGTPYLAPLEEKLLKYAPKCRHIHASLDDCLSIPVIDIGKANGNTVSVDMGWNGAIRLEDITHILNGADIFFANETEGAYLTGLESPHDILNRLSEYCSCVVLKLGGKGSVVKYNGAIYECSPVKIDVIDTTGAGDCFAAGFLTAFLEGHDMLYCSRFANAAGGLCAGLLGGVNAAFCRERVVALMDGI